MANYAFIKNNIVTNIAVFEDDVTEDILDLFRIHHKADLISLCDENSCIGGDYIDNQFRSLRPYPSWIWDKEKKNWISPTPMPENDNFYYWDEEILNWVVVSS